jgi:hypothetical protein
MTLFQDRREYHGVFYFRGCANGELGTYHVIQLARIREKEWKWPKSHLNSSSENNARLTDYSP